MIFNAFINAVPKPDPILRLTFEPNARFHQVIAPRSVIRWKSAMGKKLDLEAMNFDELWLLHEELTKVLTEKITAEKLELERRLAQLNRASPIDEAEDRSANSRTGRRKYPKVLPKYRNPSAPTETWSGRGKQPRWLVEALRSGHKLDDLLIASPEKPAGNKVRRGRRS
jgi:DNA-binding protein H-NS